MSVFSSPRPVAGGPIIDFNPADCCLEIERLSLAYGETSALRELTLRVPRHRVTAFIGPSGCGKSTLLRALNRLHDLNDDVRLSGRIRL